MFGLFFNYFIVVQLQLSAFFSPPPPPHPNPPPSLTFNWNIINKRKSKQNITRDIEIKNNVTIARGEWGGDSGERGGFGWGGVEGWGENVDNSN